MIDAARQPCLMCEDAPCIAACEPGALRADLPRKIAEARISPMDCLAHQGTLCTVCSERCPEPGAIHVDRGKPSVVTAACTGCGICAHVCPAPRRAILLLPLRTRGEQTAAP
jgi:Pyruvate/2-oxoacid:ferredoxin oxidoreductase delta subunit